MTQLFSLIFFYQDTNYYCLVKPIIVLNKIEYRVMVKYVDFGLELQEEYIFKEEYGKIIEEGFESILRKKTAHALSEYLVKKRLLHSSEF